MKTPRMMVVVLAAFASSCGHPAAVCGDGTVVAPEACDDGAANGTPGHCKSDCSGLPARVSITGDVFAFLTEVSGPRVANARISVLERPDVHAITGADAHFELDDLEEGTEATLVMDHPDFYPTQTATIVLGPHGVHPFVIQPLSKDLYNALSGLFPPLEQDSHCVIATTVTRLGGTVHVSLRQGEPGAQVSTTPPLPSTSGPVYFGENVLPDPTLTATTRDGGVLYYLVPPGDYLLGATKKDVAFAPVKLKCRPGYLVNAGPPPGVQANVIDPDWGADEAADAYTAATDALCDQTAACVNMTAGDSYPPATVDSCKTMFRRALSFVDAACDAQVHLRDAWKTVLVCRASSCALALGGDTACATEEQAWVDAMAAYAPCYSMKHGLGGP